MVILVAGVSGVGKSTVIKKLTTLSLQYEFIKTHTTRAPRIGGDEKISISVEEFLRNEKAGMYFEKGQLYDTFYGSPAEPFFNALFKGQIPVSGTSLQSVNKTAIPNTRLIYLLPPSLEELRRRLSLDDRDPTGTRFWQGCRELEEVKAGKYDAMIDRIFINDKCPETTAKHIDNFCKIYHSP